MREDSADGNGDFPMRFDDFAWSSDGKTGEAATDGGRAVVGTASLAQDLPEAAQK